MTTREEAHLFKAALGPYYGLEVETSLLSCFNSLSSLSKRTAATAAFLTLPTWLVKPKDCGLRVKESLELRETVFAFLYDEKLSTGNNACEPEVRNVKVKTKVSDLFRLRQHIYAYLKSIVQTLNKQKANIFEAFSQLAMLENPTPKHT